MTLSKSEMLCKWSIFVLLIASIVLPFPLIEILQLKQSYYAFDGILIFLLYGVFGQGIVGLIAWFMICCDNEKGKKLLISTYLTTFAAYGAYTLYLHVSMLFPNSVTYPTEHISMLILFAISAGIMLMQHFWTRYMF